MLWDMIESATELYHGHVKITAKGYLDEHQLFMTIEEDGLSGSIRQDPRIRGIAGRVRGFALLSCGEGDSARTQPVELLGINPGEESTVTRLHDRVKEGTFLSGSDTKEVILGNGLAKRLEARVGSEIVAMGQDVDGSIAAEIFTVAGIIVTADPIRDASLAVVGRKTLQNMLVLDGRLHEWAIAMKRPIGADKYAQELQARLPGVEVTSWNRFLPEMGQMLDLWRVLKYIYALIFYFAVILVTVNTMYMAFFERIREFGIMGAVGLKPGRLSLMIVLEGFFMSGISAIAGCVAGSLISLYLSIHYIDLSAYISTVSYGGTAIQPRIRCYMDINNIVIPVVMIIILGVIVALFPARRLRRLKPVDVLKEV
jgi:ABC-type lipoprotein release transport system permease subunit